jgi:hypothetical protein
MKKSDLDQITGSHGRHEPGGTSQPCLVPYISPPVVLLYCTRTARTCSVAGQGAEHQGIQRLKHAGVSRLDAEQAREEGGKRGLRVDALRAPQQALPPMYYCSQLTPHTCCWT